MSYNIVEYRKTLFFNRKILTMKIFSIYEKTCSHKEAIEFHKKIEQERESKLNYCLNRMKTDEIFNKNAIENAERRLNIWQEKQTVSSHYYNIWKELISKTPDEIKKYINESKMKEALIQCSPIYNYEKQ